MTRKKTKKASTKRIYVVLSTLSGWSKLDEIGVTVVRCTDAEANDIAEAMADTPYESWDVQMPGHMVARGVSRPMTKTEFMKSLKEELGDMARDADG
jgi:hypothetical protein